MGVGVFEFGGEPLPRRIAVKVIDLGGNEVMRVMSLDGKLEQMRLTA